MAKLLSYLMSKCVGRRLTQMLADLGQRCGNLLLASILALSASLLTSERALACSCAVLTLKEEVSRADLVFAGKVNEIVEANSNLELINSTDLIKIRFDVIKVWKGEFTEIQEVYTSRYSTSCGYRFSLQESFLVFAYKDNRGNFGTGSCSRNNIYSPLILDVQELNGLVIPTPTEIIIGSIITIILGFSLRALIQRHKVL